MGEYILETLLRIDVLLVLLIVVSLGTWGLLKIAIWAADLALDKVWRSRLLIEYLCHRREFIEWRKTHSERPAK